MTGPHTRPPGDGAGRGVESSGRTIDLLHVDVSFDGTVVLEGVSLHVGEGEVVALLGASGSGKSTILRVIAGLLRPDRGRVRLGGVDVTDVPTHRRGVGMVFQDNQLFPHRDVIDNVAFGLKMAGVAAPERRARAEAWLRRVGLEGFGTRTVTELSGGEAKRVALARTLVVEPAVVLLDEPLTGLDRELHDELLTDLSRLLRDTRATAILVTHDPAEAEACADRLVRMDSLNGIGPGGTGEPRAPGGTMSVGPIAAADTHDLRRRVLRDGDPTAEVVWPDDAEPTTTHLGAVDARGRLVGVSTWIVRGTTAQLRGMAVDPSAAGSGVGSALLAAGVEHCRASGCDTLWANARTSALGFYERAGFDIGADEFATPDTGLPHRRIELRL